MKVLQIPNLHKERATSPPPAPHGIVTSNNTDSTKSHRQEDVHRYQEKVSSHVSTRGTPTTPNEGSDDSSGSPMDTEDMDDEGYGHEYLSGVKLSIVMFSIALVGFLMLLDTSVVATVSSHFLQLLDF